MHTRKGLRLEDDVDLFLQAIHELSHEDILSKGSSGFPVGTLFQKIKLIVNEEPLKTGIWDYSSVREFADTLTRRRILNRLVNEKGLPLYSINMFMEQGMPANVMYSRRTPLFSNAKRTLLLSAEEAQEMEKKSYCGSYDDDDCFYDSDVYMTLRQDVSEGVGVIRLCIQDRWGYPYKGKISDLIGHDQCLAIISRAENRSDFLTVDFAVYERENGSLHCTEASVQTKNNTRFFHSRGSRAYVMKYCPYVPPAPCTPCPVVPVVPVVEPVVLDESNIMFFELKRRSPRGDNTISVRDKDHFLEDLISGSEGTVTVIINSKKYLADSIDVIDDGLDVILTSGLSTSADKGAIVVFSAESISVQKCSCNARRTRPPTSRVQRRAQSARRSRNPNVEIPAPSQPQKPTDSFEAEIVSGNKKGSTSMVVKGNWKVLDDLVKNKEVAAQQLFKTIIGVEQGDTKDEIKITFDKGLLGTFPGRFIYTYYKNEKSYGEEDDQEDIVDMIHALGEKDLSSVDWEDVLGYVDKKHRWMAFALLTKDSTQIKSATPTLGNEAILQLQNVSPSMVKWIGDPIILAEKIQVAPEPLETPLVQKETIEKETLEKVVPEKVVPEEVVPEEVVEATREKVVEATREKVVEATREKVVEATREKVVETTPEKSPEPTTPFKVAPSVVIITYYDENDEPMKEKHMISKIEFENNLLPTPISGAVGYSIEHS